MIIFIRSLCFRPSPFFVVSSFIIARPPFARVLSLFFSFFLPQEIMTFGLVNFGCLSLFLYYLLFPCFVFCVLVPSFYCMCLFLSLFIYILFYIYWSTFYLFVLQLFYYCLSILLLFYYCLFILLLSIFVYLLIYHLLFLFFVARVAF